jgi:hypothetical protein
MTTQIDYGVKQAVLVLQTGSVIMSAHRGPLRAHIGS